MRDYIRSILAEYYNVLEASQGEEALTVLQSQNVDFIVSDLMMPVMDGMELSRRVKSNFAISHIPLPDAYGRKHPTNRALKVSV